MDFFLADDLSGALDAAAAFHRVGRRVRIVLSALDWTAEADDEVVGVTTETRNVSPDRAASIVAGALRHARRQGGRLVYKKIDSTLRGPVAAELRALAEALPGARILFAPANPGVGRTVLDGVLLVRGVPVAETEFGRDPVCPVRESRIARLVGGGLGERIWIPDTSTAADLTAAVGRLVADGGEWAAVGSGALARPVAESLARGGPATARAAEDLRATEAAARGVLLLGGSAHPANRRQAAELARTLGAVIRELRVEDVDGAVRAAVGDLAQRKAALVMVEERRRDSAAILRAAAGAGARVLADSGARDIFATGGETAFALCLELGISSLVFAAEIEPGLSVSVGEARGESVRLAVKPGGFGDAETWVRAWRALAGDAGH